MKRILAYGDSNTWGFLPVDTAVGMLERLAVQDRWTGVANAILGPDYEMLEDALPGRTLAVDRPDMASGSMLPANTFNGLSEMTAALLRNVPLDGVVIALGTNDLLIDPEIAVEAYLERLSALVELVGSFKLPLPLKGMAHPPWVLVIAPPTISLHPGNPNAERAEAKRRLIWKALVSHAAAERYALIDSASVIEVLEGDGVHLDKAAHQKLAVSVAQAITAVIRDRGAK